MGLGALPSVCYARLALVCRLPILTQVQLCGTDCSECVGDLAAFNLRVHVIVFLALLELPVSPNNQVCESQLLFS